jgi:hypothetical protein
MPLTHGVTPEVRTFSHSSDEAAWLKQYIQGLQAEGAALESICITARTKHLLQSYMGQLKTAGFDVYEVKRDSAEHRDRPGIRVATMHRVKGL